MKNNIKLQKPYKIGITGGIACGKSLVEKIIENFQVESIDADLIVHDILQHDPKIIKQITDIFGTKILKKDNGIKRNALAKVVFKDYEKLAQLEKIIHPEVFRRIKSFLDTTENDIIAVLLPLLFETNAQHMFDSIWVVTAEEWQQIQRLKIRDNMSEEEAKQRIQAQMPVDKKASMGDVVLDNSDSIANLQNKVGNIISEIRKRQR